MKRKIIAIVVVAILLVAGISSGWVYNSIKTNHNIELSNLRESFILQYGTKAVINELVSPKKVYAVSWTSEDGYNNISWNIGGIWITVYSVPPSDSAETTQ